MSRDRRKDRSKNLGTMQAATPADMSESEEAARQAEARAREVSSTTPETPPSMQDALDKQALEQMQKAYDAARQNMKARGGYIKAADGCAVRGKTRGKMV